MAENEKTVAAATEKKPEKKQKKDKPSFFARMGKFFRDYKAELGKVTWASREDTLKNFVVVGVTVVIVGVVTGLLDVAFNAGINALAQIRF